MLDANVVIEAHRLRIWDQLITTAEVACPATVIRDEARFYSKDEHGVPPAICLPRLVAQGRIAKLEATADDLRGVAAILVDDVLNGLHPGETESLALLVTAKAEGRLFCTGDHAAIRALALLGLSQRGISFEEALRRTGLSRSLPRHFTESFFCQALREGQEHRLRGLGLRTQEC